MRVKQPDKNIKFGGVQERKLRKYRGEARERKHRYSRNIQKV